MTIFMTQDNFLLGSPRRNKNGKPMESTLRRCFRCSPKGIGSESERNIFEVSLLFAAPTSLSDSVVHSRHIIPMVSGNFIANFVYSVILASDSDMLEAMVGSVVLKAVAFGMPG